MAKMMLVLTREEIEQSIPYQFIAETMGGSVWQTGRRRRRWVEEFTESERHACTKLRNQAIKWYLHTGVPDEVTMALSTYSLWCRLAAFCASLPL